MGEPATTRKARGLEVETRKDDAQRQKIKSVSHSGGTKSAPPNKAKLDVDPSVRAMFKGFDDDDF